MHRRASPTRRRPLASSRWWRGPPVAPVSQPRPGIAVACARRACDRPDLSRRPMRQAGQIDLPAHLLRVNCRSTSDARRQRPARGALHSNVDGRRCRSDYHRHTRHDRDQAGLDRFRVPVPLAGARDLPALLVPAASSPLTPRRPARWIEETPDRAEDRVRSSHGSPLALETRRPRGSLADHRSRRSSPNPSRSATSTRRCPWRRSGWNTACRATPPLRRSGFARCVTAPARGVRASPSTIRSRFQRCRPALPTG
jgi:hypothetical protein